jgi:hypothetical protein
MFARLPDCLNNKQHNAHIIGMLPFASFASIPALVNAVVVAVFRDIA